MYINFGLQHQNTGMKQMPTTTSGFRMGNSTSDLDVFEYDWSVTRKHKRLFTTIVSEPAFSGLLLANGLIGRKKPKVKFHSKWFYDSTFGNDKIDVHQTGALLYKLNDTDYFLELQNWRPFNIHDPAADWLSTYPLISAICKWLHFNNFTEVISLSSCVIHHFLDSDKYLHYPPEELYVRSANTASFTETPAKPTNKEQRLMLSPPHYLFPQIWADFKPTGKALNVVAGSDGLDSIDETACSTLCEWLTKNYKIKISKTSIDKTLKEIKTEIEKSSDAISETLITNKGNPTNNGVMYG